MIRNRGLAIAFGLGVTALELLAVARLSRPDPHLEDQPPELLRPAPVVVAPPPTPRRELELGRNDLAPLAQASPLAPAPAIAPTAMPSLAQAHAGPAIALGLPGLGEGLGGLSIPGGQAPAAQTIPASLRRKGTSRYPILAQRRGVEGYVLVRLRVEATGRVSDVVVVESQPPGIFDDSARQAARRYLFSPARRGDEAVASTLEQKIVYRLR